MPDTACCYIVNKSLKSDVGVTMEILHTHAFTDTLQLTGMIVPSVTHQVFIAVPMKGFLKAVYVRPGDEVSRGKLLALLENPEYSRLQSEYLEIKSRYEYLKQDYARQGELGLEQATSLKNVQKARSEFLIIESKLFSLRNQLEFIGIKPDSIHINNIISTIGIYSPISGTIAFNEVNIGQFYSEETSVFNVMDLTHLGVACIVNQNRISHLEKSMKLTFISPYQNNKQFQAEVIAITPDGTTHDQYRVYAEFVDPDRRFSPGVKVRSIVEFTDSAMMAPTDAIIHYTGKEYLISSGYDSCFRLYRITTGKQYGALTRINPCFSPKPAGMIITGGMDKLICKEGNK